MEILGMTSMVNYTLATNLGPILPGFCTSDIYTIFWPTYGQIGLTFALEIESSHGLE
jgi:hypothetical protein